MHPTGSSWLSCSGCRATAPLWMWTCPLLLAVSLTASAALPAQPSGVFRTTPSRAARDTLARIEALKGLRQASEVLARVVRADRSDDLRAVEASIDSVVARLESFVEEERRRTRTHLFGRLLSDSEVRRVRVLAIDPYAASPQRASMWWSGIVAVPGETEAILQVNLCDLTKRCRRTDAVSMVIVAPTDRSADFTPLADLSGLRGNSRVGVSWSQEISNATGEHGFNMDWTAARPTLTFSDDMLLTQERRVWKHKASIGSSWRTTTHSQAVNYALAVDYEEFDPVTLCEPAPAGVDGTLQCRDHRIGLPQRTTRHLAEVDLRRTLRNLYVLRLIAAHDLTASVSSFALPLYGFLGKDHKAAGGVRLDYRTDHRKLIVSLFVGRGSF